MIGRCLVIVAACTPSAWAQQEPIVVPLTPDMVFDELRAAYGERPWAERVTATLHFESGDERRDSFVLRVSPTEKGDVGMLRLEAGPLTVFGDSERTIIEHSAVKDRVVVTSSVVDDPSEGLRELLPTLILPQFDILGGDGAFEDADGPVPAVEWTTAELSDMSGHAFITMSGTTDVGDAFMVVDAETLRLHTCILPVQTDEPMRLTLEFRPAVRTERWSIEVGEREPVASIAALAEPHAPPEH